MMSSTSHQRKHKLSLHKQPSHQVIFGGEGEQHLMNDMHMFDLGQSGEQPEVRVRISLISFFIVSTRAPAVGR